MSNKNLPSQAPETPPKNGFLDLIINIIIPSFLLMKGKNYLPSLDATQILIIALAFPLVYGVYDWVVNKEKNFISLIGFLSILLSGIVGVFELSPQLIAIKEAAVPFIIGLVILISNYTNTPIAPKFLYHDEVFDKQTINERLPENGEEILQLKIKKASYYLFLSFMLSAFLNYVLAKYFVVSPAGTDAFNDELGKMTLYSYPIIVVPSMLIMFGIIRYIYISIKRLTNLESEQIFKFNK